ncbi:hypothetical protein [Paraburkholderia tropica]|uniref:hypothetical protein n=1 Tax=Paraburkholderia tropica TaxID=92647 RepID=UPI002AAFF4A4|nr:hypothetical protein [Paraburkholderia tropica]
MTDTVRAVVLIAYGVILGYGAFAIWPFAPFHTEKDWVDVATALGTCAAAVIALGLGYFEVFRRNNAERKERNKAVDIAIILAKRALTTAEGLRATLECDRTERAIQNAVDVLRDRRESIDRINLYKLEEIEISMVEEIRTAMTKLISICSRQDMTKLQSVEFPVRSVNLICEDVRDAIGTLEESRQRF